MSPGRGARAPELGTPAGVAGKRVPRTERDLFRQPWRCLGRLVGCLGGWRRGPPGEEK